jgi:hypothetical protein
MNYSEETLARLALFHRASILMVKLNRDDKISQKLNDFVFSFGKELASDTSIDINDIVSPDKFSHVKLSDEKEKFLEELSYINTMVLPID